MQFFKNKKLIVIFSAIFIIIFFTTLVILILPKISQPKPIQIRSQSLQFSFPRSELTSALSSQNKAILGIGSKIEIVKEFPPRKTEFGFNALVVNWKDSLGVGSKVISQVSTSEDGKVWSDWQDGQVDEDGDGKKPAPDDENFSNIIIARGNFVKHRIKIITDPQESGSIEKIKLIYIDSEENFYEKLLSSITKKIDFTNQIVSSAFAATTSKKATDPPYVISRKAWGADPKLMRWTPEYVKAKKIIVHHTVMTSKDPNPAATVRAIYYFHSVIRDWGDIGYNFLVDSSGNIYEGRYGGPDVVGGHVYHYNQGSVGVAVMGDFRTQRPNTPIKNALSQITVWKSATNGINPFGHSIAGSPGYKKSFPNITYHGYLWGTECAGKYLNAFVPELRKMAQYMPLEVLARYSDGAIRRIKFSKKTAMKDALTIIKNYSGVVLTEPNYLRFISEFPDDAVPNDTYFPKQWNFKKIKQDTAWKLEMGDPSVKVAVLDTGAAYENFSDTSGTYKKFTDFSGTLFDTTNSYDFINRDTHANDDNGHGTAVVDIIASSTNNLSGNSSVSPNITILPLKIAARSGIAMDYDLARSIRLASNAGSDIIYISLASPNFSYNVQKEIDNAFKKGIIVVGAAGNKNSSIPYFPAGMKNVLGVGATRYDNKKTYYSNFGNWLDIFAPGGDLSLDQNKDGTKDGLFLPTILASGKNYTKIKYQYLQGTSYAGAHVAAVAALLKSKGIENPTTLISTLVSNTKDLGTAGIDNIYRYGLLQSFDALE